MEQLIKKLNTPIKIQDFLDKIPFNFEEKGETYMSPAKMLRENKAHCFEGALFAYLCLQHHKIESFILDLKVKKEAYSDSDHTLCIFNINDYWGAISKTNHSVLRWRDPIYKTVRELAFSYFHEYFLDSGEKTLESFSKPFDVFKKFGFEWIKDEKDLDQVAESLDRSSHTKFIPEKNKRLVRKAGKTEIKGAGIKEWNKSKKVL